MVGIDAFLQQYSLETQEGIILMCLTEALLRIPDTTTADALIEDKLSGAKWDAHAFNIGRTACRNLYAMV